MRAISLALPLFLLAAGTAGAQRLDGTFFIIGDDETTEFGASLVLLGTTASVEGEVVGTGTDGDFVEIGVFTDLPTSMNADDKQARVRQSRFSTISIFIDSDDPTRDLELTLNPDKCSIDGKVNAPKAKGSVTVSCSGEDIYSDISATQEASIQAAFANTKVVKIKINSDGSKGSIQIKLTGPAGEPG
jgi:hypothetical protein